MATNIYITAGLPALDSAGSLPTDDKSRFYITAGLVANDYTPPAGGVPLSNPFSRPFEQALGRGGF